LQALRSLVEKNLIIAERQQSEERGNEPTLYRLHQADDDEDIRQGAEPPPAEDDPAPGKKTQPPLVKKFNLGVGQETLPSPRSRNLTTQQKELQQTVLQEIDTSKIRKV